MSEKLKESSRPQPIKHENLYTYISPEELRRQREYSTRDIWDIAQTLRWSERKYNISEFLSVFELPQIVKVQTGDFDKDVCNLHEGQILVLHKLSTDKKVVATDSQGNNIFLPLISPVKVDLRATNYKDSYDTIEDVAKVMPKLVRIGAGYYGENSEQTVYMGQKLLLLRMDYSRDVLECKDYNTGQILRLTHECEAQFLPLADPREFSLEELVKLFKLPVFVQFIDGAIVREFRKLQLLLTSAIGIVRVERTFVDTHVVASSKVNGEITATTFSQDCNVVVSPAYSSLTDDVFYQKLCERFQCVIEFELVENIILADVFNNQEKRYKLEDEMLKEGYQMKDSTSYPGESDDEEIYESISDLKEELPPKPPPRKKCVQNEGINNDPDEKPPLPRKPSQDKDNPQGENTVIPPKIAPKPPRKPNVPDKPSSTHPEHHDKSNLKLGDMQQERSPSPAHPAKVQDIPDNLSTLSVAEVCACLDILNMGKYIEVFQEEKIDGSLLMDLDEDSFISLGLSKFHCTKIQRFLAGWRPNIGSN